MQKMLSRQDNRSRDKSASIKTLPEELHPLLFFITTKKSFCESLPEEGPSEELLLLVRLDLHLGLKRSQTTARDP